MSNLKNNDTKKQTIKKKNNRKDELVTWEIAKTAEAIRKKHQALKMGKMIVTEDAETNLRPIVEPLKELLEKRNKKMKKEEEEEEEEEEEKEDNKTTPMMMMMKTPPSSPFSIAKPPSPPSSPDSFQSTSSENLRIPAKRARSSEHQEVVYAAPKDTLETTMREVIQEPKTGDFMRDNLGPLAREYLTLFFKDTKNVVDTVYGVFYGGGDVLKIGDSVFDVDNDDNILIKGTRYRGTHGLYELIFKRLPDDSVYTDADL